MRLKSSSCQRRAAALGGQPHCHQKLAGTETSGSPREETRLLCRLCIELEKGQRDTWAGLYTSCYDSFPLSFYSLDCSFSLFTYLER